VIHPPALSGGGGLYKRAYEWRVFLGNRLTPEQSKSLLSAFDETTLRGRRDRTMVAMRLGCGLRRAELLAITMKAIQQREDHWVIADLIGKGGHVRTVPIPRWVKAAMPVARNVWQPIFVLMPTAAARLQIAMPGRNAIHFRSAQPREIGR